MCSRYECNQSIHPYLPHKPRTLLSVVLQNAFTKLTVWPAFAQLDVTQFLPSAGSETKLLSLKSNNIQYIIQLSNLLTLSMRGEGYSKNTSCGPIIGEEKYRPLLLLLLLLHMAKNTRIDRSMQQEKSHRTRKKVGFLHIWPFSLFAHLIK